MAPREIWTDERLDEFKASVNQRFDGVEKRFDQIDARFDRVEGDIREIRQTMVQGFFVLIGVMVTGFAGLAGLMVF